MTIQIGTINKEKVAAHQYLTKKGFKHFDNTSIGASYAKIENDMLRKASVDLFGRIFHYVPTQATNIDKFLYI